MAVGVGENHPNLINWRDQAVSALIGAHTWQRPPFSRLGRPTRACMARRRVGLAASERRYRTAA
jgi:hypothetical protein